MILILISAEKKFSVRMFSGGGEDVLQSKIGGNAVSRLAPAFSAVAVAEYPVAHINEDVAVSGL